MCIGKPECQRCETCGIRKWQLWADSEMHPRGCPWGHDRMDKCPDVTNSVRRLRWAMGEGISVTDAGRAMVEQFDAITEAQGNVG